MAHPVFDTLKFVEKLKAAGMPERQAIALSDAQNEILAETSDHFLATKTDIYELKHEVTEIRQELKQEIVEVKQELKQEMGDLKSNQKLLQWMMGFMLTGTGALIIKAFITV